MIVQQTVFDRKPLAPLVTIRVCLRAYPEGIRYAVARRYGPDTIIYEEKDYATEFVAYLVAAAAAVDCGCRLDAPASVKSRLIAFWYRRGRRMFYANEPRALCANKYERQGYDVAETEFLGPSYAYDAYEDEKNAKPGLVDCVPVTVKPGEYGAGRRVKGKKVTA
jgi:hypothetical protein